MSDSDLSFSEGTSADVDRIYQFCNRQTRPNDLERRLSFEGVSTLLSDKRKGRVFIGVKDSQIVLAAFIYPEWSEWRNLEMWWITNVFLTPEVNQLDELQKLFQLIRSSAEEQGVGTIRLWDSMNTKCMLQVVIDNGMKPDFVLFEEKLNKLPN